MTKEMLCIVIINHIDRKIFVFIKKIYTVSYKSLYTIFFFFFHFFTILFLFYSAITSNINELLVITQAPYVLFGLINTIILYFFIFKIKIKLLPVIFIFVINFLSVLCFIFTRNFLIFWWNFCFFFH